MPSEPARCGCGKLDYECRTTPPDLCGWFLLGRLNKLRGQSGWVTGRGAEIAQTLMRSAEAKARAKALTTK